MKREFPGHTQVITKHVNIYSTSLALKVMQFKPQQEIENWQKLKSLMTLVLVEVR